MTTRSPGAFLLRLDVHDRAIPERLHGAPRHDLERAAGAALERERDEHAEAKFAVAVWHLDPHLHHPRLEIHARIAICSMARAWE